MIDKKAIVVIAKTSAKDLIFIRDFIDAGKIETVIDRSYPLEQTAEAHRYSEKGHAKGKIVTTL